MQETLNINNTSNFCDFLGAALQVNNCHKFIINKDGCNISVIDANSTVRAFINTKSITSKNEITFCLNESLKLRKCLLKIQDLNKEFKEIDLGYDGTFLTFNNSGFKFKLSTIKEKVIQRFVSNSLSRELDSVCSVNFTPMIAKQVLSLSNICSSDAVKLDFYKEGDQIIVELDDKSYEYTDSITIPISKDFKGQWLNSFSIKLETFQLFNIIKTDKIEMNLSSINALDVKAENDDCDIRIIASLIKA